MLFPAKVKMALAGVTVAGGAAAAALLGPAGPAVGQSSEPIVVQVQVNSPATLVARGAGIDVSVTVSCSGPAGTTGSVGLNVTERAGSEVAVGIGGASFDCTGASQTTTVLVTPTFQRVPVIWGSTRTRLGAPIRIQGGGGNWYPAPHGTRGTDSGFSNFHNLAPVAGHRHRGF